MGKRKIEIKKIEDKQSRAVTFSKRRDGLFKKASKFADLFNLDLALVVVSSAGNLFECGNTRVVMDRNLHPHHQPQPSTSDESVSSYRLLLDTDIYKMSVPELEQHLRDLDAMESELPRKEVEKKDQGTPMAIDDGSNTDSTVFTPCSTLRYIDDADLMAGELYSNKMELILSDNSNFVENLVVENLVVEIDDLNTDKVFTPCSTTRCIDGVDLMVDELLTSTNNSVVFIDENLPTGLSIEELIAAYDGSYVSEPISGNSDHGISDQELLTLFGFSPFPF